VEALASESRKQGNLALSATARTHVFVLGLRALLCRLCFFLSHEMDRLCDSAKKFKSSRLAPQKLTRPPLNLMQASDQSRVAGIA
jgi:hypothetical protein